MTTTYDLTVEMLDGAIDTRQGQTLDEMTALVRYYALVGLRNILIASVDPERPPTADISDAIKVEILRYGVAIDEQQIDQLVDAAGALYTDTGQYAPTDGAIAALWAVVQWHRQVDADIDTEEDIGDLIEASSLGSPEAKAHRARTPPAVVAELLAKLKEDGEPDDHVDEPTGDATPL